MLNSNVDIDERIDWFQEEVMQVSSLIYVQLWI